MKMLTNKQVIEKIKNAKNVAIFTHKNPDPDACGSAFGMQGLCEGLGTKSKIFMDSTWATELKKIFPIDKVFRDFSAKNFDLVVVVDMHIASLLDEAFVSEIKKAKDIVIVDHHPIYGEEKVLSKNICLDMLASASQVVANLFREAGITPSKECAEYIYAGLMGDTARFLHSNVDQKVFECANYLLSCGTDIQKVYDSMYRSKTKEQIKANKFFFQNLKYLNNRVGYIIFTQKDFKRMGVEVEDIKVLTNEVTCIDGIDVSFFCYETRKCSFKVSLRCRKGFAVNTLAVKMGGGGHVPASAFEIKTSKRQLKKLIPIWSEEVLNG